jgi:hypothetical protein
MDDGGWGGVWVLREGVSEFEGILPMIKGENGCVDWVKRFRSPDNHGPHWAMSAWARLAHACMSQACEPKASFYT